MIFHTPFIVSQVKYSSEKSLLLDVLFLNPIDDLNKQLYRDIADISKFGEQVETLLNVEFFTSCYGKQPVNSEVNSSSTSGREENQAKRRRSENECSIIPAQLEELSAPSNDTSLITAFASSNEKSGASVQAVTGASATLGDKGDETVLESSQQCYTISLCE